MRDVPSAVTSTYPGTRTASVSVIYERPIPDFTSRNMEYVLRISQDAAEIPQIKMDTCNIGANVYRVCNLDDVLYLQEMLSFDNPLSWFTYNTPLMPGSRPGVEDNSGSPVVWFQGSDGVVGTIDIYTGQTDFPGIEAFAVPVACAPVAEGCYIQYLDGDWLAISHVGNTGVRTNWEGRIYGDLTTASFFDAVILDGAHYIFTMDKANGRTLELKRMGDQWLPLTQVLPLDIVDNTSGFLLSSASAFNGKIYVTGRMVRSNDIEPLSMDIFAVGPGPYSFGRYKFLTENNVGGKLFAHDDMVYYMGTRVLLSSPSTEIFGTIASVNTWNAQKAPAIVEISETESGGAQMSMIVIDNLNPADNVKVNVVIDDHPILLGTYAVKDVNDAYDASGFSRSVSCVGKAMGELERWHPFQSIYLASQSSTTVSALSLSGVMRAKSVFGQFNTDFLGVMRMNEFGILYTVARAAPNTVSQGEFYVPLSDIMRPRYGVGINYTKNVREEPETNECGDLPGVAHNGIVAIYGEEEHLGEPGIALYLIDNDTFVLLESVPCVIERGFLQWLRIKYVDGRITVYEKTEESVRGKSLLWRTLIDTVYNSSVRGPNFSPDIYGHAFVFLENVSDYSTSPGFTSEDMVIPVESVDVYGVDELSVIADDEIIRCKRSNANNFSKNSSITYVPMVAPNWGETTTFSGFPIVLSGPDEVNLDDYYKGGCLRVTGGPGEGKNFLITGYDAVSPRLFTINRLHNPLEEDWHYYIGIEHGDPPHGYYATGNYRVIYVSEDPESILGFDGVFEYTDDGKTARENIQPSQLTIYPCLSVITRGDDDTSATAHSKCVKVSLYPTNGDHKTLVKTIHSFSCEQDISVADAISRVFAMAGTKRPTFANKLENPYIYAPWVSSAWATDTENFIADMTIPLIPDGEMIGISYRNQETPTQAISNGPKSTTGFMALLRRVSSEYWVEHWEVVGSGYVLAERCALTFVPYGTIRFSVQENVCSVWINGDFVNAFATPEAGNGTSVSAIASYVTPTDFRIQELCEKIYDLPVDTQSDGWSAVMTIIAQRRILFADTADGSIFCYQNRVQRGALPDIVTGYSRVRSDAQVTRVRAEGIKIAEYANWNDTREYGDIGIPVNAAYANTPGEVGREAKLVQEISLRDAIKHKMNAVLYPSVTPGDTWSVTLPDGDRSIAVLGVGMVLSQSKDGLVFEMEIEGVDGKPFVVSSYVSAEFGEDGHQFLLSGGALSGTGPEIIDGGTW